MKRLNNMDTKEEILKQAYEILEPGFSKKKNTHHIFVSEDSYKIYEQQYKECYRARYKYKNIFQKIIFHIKKYYELSINNNSR